MFFNKSELPFSGEKRNSKTNKFKFYIESILTCNRISSNNFGKSILNTLFDDFFILHLRMVSEVSLIFIF